MSDEDIKKEWELDYITSRHHEDSYET